MAKNGMEPIEGVDSVRRNIAMICVALGFASTARAGSIVIDFEGLAAYAGQVISTEFSVGIYTVFINDSLVIGPGDPGYSGVIGVLPAKADAFDVNLQPSVPPVLQSITTTFAPATSNVIAWYGMDNVSGLYWIWAGTAPDSFTSQYSPGYETGTIFMEANLGNGAQITSITLGLEQGLTAPEPPSLVLAGIGLLVATAIRIRQRGPSPSDDGGIGAPA